MAYYSVKVRTSLNGKHVSGAERIVEKENIPTVVKELLGRQQNKDFDFSNVKIEKIKETPRIIKKALRIKTFSFENYQEALKFAVNLITQKVKIPKNKLKNIINLLYIGASPDKTNMRGAMIVNQEGKRIELDKFRGVRTVLVDFIDRNKITKKLIKKGYTERTVDALALATKNLNYKDFLAEFCISDDMDYTTGYVALDNTYIRLSPLKPYGLDKGGRIYFVKSDIDLQDFYSYLQTQPVLIEDIDE